MSRYLLNKFLYTVDRDPGLVERYRTDPEATVADWEREYANRLLNATAPEASTWQRLTERERAALVGHDHPELFALGAHPFLTLTLFIALFERDHPPMGYQTAYARALDHVALPYPDIAT